MNKILDFLGSLNFGLIAGFSIVGLLITGSVCMLAAPDVYEGLKGEDIKFFLVNPSPIHFWFYLLSVMFGLFGLNLTLCTARAFKKKRQKFGWKATVYGSTLAHAAVVLALASHLVSGLTVGERPPFYLTESGAMSVAGGPAPVKMRIVEVDDTYYANGMPRKADLKVEVGENKDIRSLGYNGPITEGLGSTQYLMMQFGRMPSEAFITVNGTRTSVRRHAEIPAAGTPYLVQVDDLYMPGEVPDLEVPALLANYVDDRGNRKGVLLKLGMGVQEPVPGLLLSFDELVKEPMAMVRERHNQGIPLLLFSIIVFLAGMALVTARVIERR